MEIQKGEIILYQREDGSAQLNVRVEGDTVWLTQQLMAELFNTSKQNISLHIQNIYEEGELSPEATVKKFLTVQKEGIRDVRRQLDYYNLDMIISVGYRNLWSQNSFSYWRIILREFKSIREKHN